VLHEWHPRFSHFLVVESPGEVLHIREFIPRLRARDWGQCSDLDSTDLNDKILNYWKIENPKIFERKGKEGKHKAKKIKKMPL
jgi:hypothetical protein